MTPTGIVATAKVYQKLEKFASQSNETIHARELIKAAVMNKRN